MSRSVMLMWWRCITSNLGSTPLSCWVPSYKWGDVNVELDQSLVLSYSNVTANTVTLVMGGLALLIPQACWLMGQRDWTGPTLFVGPLIGWGSVATQLNRPNSVCLTPQGMGLMWQRDWIGPTVWWYMVGLAILFAVQNCLPWLSQDLMVEVWISGSLKLSTLPMPTFTGFSLRTN